MDASPSLGIVAAAVALQEGEVDAALTLVTRDDHRGMMGRLILQTSAIRSAILLALGDRGGAVREIERAHVSSVRGEVMHQFSMLGYGGEVLVELGDEVFARDGAAYLARYPLLRSFGPFGHVNPDALRGWLALRFDAVDEAEQHFNTGLEWASRPDVRFGVDAGRCHQGLADVAERRGDIEAAREHLDAAGALFAQHGARLYLDQVLAKKQFLKA